MGSLGVVGIAAGYWEFAQHPLTAGIEAAPLILASASTGAQTVVMHPVLDGVEFVVIPPDEGVRVAVTGQTATRPVHKNDL